LFAIASAIICTAVNRFGLYQLSQYKGIPFWLDKVIVGATTGLVMALAMNFLWRNPLRRYLRVQLAAAGIPICIHCGYDLRGSPSGRCPECGELAGAAHAKT